MNVERADVGEDLRECEENAVVDGRCGADADWARSDEQLQVNGSGEYCQDGGSDYEDAESDDSVDDDGSVDGATDENAKVGGSDEGSEYDGDDSEYYDGYSDETVDDDDESEYYSKSEDDETNSNIKSHPLDSILFHFFHIRLFIYIFTP